MFTHTLMNHSFKRLGASVMPYIKDLGLMTLHRAGVTRMLARWNQQVSSFGGFMVGSLYIFFLKSEVMSTSLVG